MIWGYHYFRKHPSRIWCHDFLKARHLLSPAVVPTCPPARPKASKMLEAPLHDRALGRWGRKKPGSVGTFLVGGWNQPHSGKNMRKSVKMGSCHFPQFFFGVKDKQILGVAPTWFLVGVSWESKKPIPTQCHPFQEIRPYYVIINLNYHFIRPYFEDVSGIG